MKNNISLTLISLISSIGIAICQPSPIACFNVNDLLEGGGNDVPAFRKIEDAAIIVYSKDSNYRFESNMSNFDDREYDLNTEEFTLALPPTHNRQKITITKADCPSYKQEITIDSITPKQVLYYNLDVPQVKPMFQLGTVSVSTLPSGAVIEIEGMPDYQKKSPITSIKIKADYWPIVIIKNGYEKIDTSIYVKPNESTFYTFTLTPSNDSAYASQEPNIEAQESNYSASTQTAEGSTGQSVQQQGNYQTNNTQYTSAGNNQYSGTGYNDQVPSPSSQPFYDKLNGYGNWVQYPNYGYVWIPNIDAGDNFAPYSSNGYWTYTSYGWTWVSNYSWGAIPFHYGRWGYDIVYGWYWVPGNQWGPAWVNWCSTNDGYYGWAPLRPRIASTSCNIYWIPSDNYVFVRQQYITSENLDDYYVPKEKNSYYIHNATVIREMSYDNNQNPVYVHGPKRQEVEYVSGEPVYMRTIQTQRENSTQSGNSNFVIVERPALTHADKNVVAPIHANNFERSGLAPVSGNSNSSSKVQQQQNPTIQHQQEVQEQKPPIQQQKPIKKQQPPVQQQQVQEQHPPVQQQQPAQQQRPPVQQSHVQYQQPAQQQPPSKQNQGQKKSLFSGFLNTIKQSQPNQQKNNNSQQNKKNNQNQQKKQSTQQNSSGQQNH